MEIFNELDFFLILMHIVTFLLIYYFFYKFIIKTSYLTLTEQFKKVYRKMIKKDSTYFAIEMLYAFFGISLVLSLIFFLSLIDKENSISVNIYFASLVLVFLYCLKKYIQKNNEN